MSVDVDLSAVGLMHTGHDFDQRRLAGTVFSDESVDFAGTHIEIDALNGVYAGKRLGDTRQLQRAIHAQPRTRAPGRPCRRRGRNGFKGGFSTGSSAEGMVLMCR